jgi:hypothetical protein
VVEPTSHLSLLGGVGREWLDESARAGWLHAA